MSRIILGLVLSSGALIGLAGCGKPVNPDRPKTVPATVTVSYGGQPVEGATVAFLPTTAQQRGAAARTDARGQAKMWTFDPGDGVIPGSYKVTITKITPVSAPSADETSPEEYARISREIESAPPKHELPEKYSKADTSDLTVEVADGGQNSYPFDLQD